MRKPYRAARALFLLALASPLGLAWLPPDRLPLGMDPDFQALLQSSFRQLSITLAATLALAMTLTVALGYASVLWQSFGRGGSSFLKAVESVPAILWPCSSTPRFPATWPAIPATSRSWCPSSSSCWPPP